MPTFGDHVRDLQDPPTLAEIHDAAETVTALRTLGVVGRAEFVADNASVLTCLREEDDLLHPYASNFLYETGERATVGVALPGKGSVHVSTHGRGRSRRTAESVRRSDGRRSLRSSCGGFRAVELAEAARVDEWSIRVESWDAGEPVVLSEDRGPGYETREVRPTTAVTDIRSAG